LNGLLKPIPPRTIGKHAARVLIDQQNLVVLDDVLDVAVKEFGRPHGLFDVDRPRSV
jgi:hypothetical protein